MNLHWDGLVRNWSLNITKLLMRSWCNNLQVSTGKCLVANQPKSSHAGYRYRALLSEWIAKNWSLTITKFSCNNLRVAPTGKCYVANQPKSSDGVGVSAAVRQYGSVSLGRSACEVLRVFERDSCDLCAWLLTVIESERLFWERISRTSSKLR